MKKLLLHLGLLLPILVSMILINFKVDPGNLYSKSLEKDVAAVLLSGSNLTGIKNFDERKVQKYFILGQTNRADCCVLGSSRCMQIGSEIFPEETFINNSVSGATLQDYMAIYQLYRSKNLLPKKILLGLDPWLLNAYNGETRWQSLKPEYDQLISIEFDQKKSTSSRSKYLQLISPSYFQQALRALKSDEKPSDFQSTDDPEPTEGGIRHDGFRIYPKDYRQMDQETINHKARKYISKKKIYRLDHFVQIDPELQSLFEKFIALTQKDGVQIAFFLSPYHPIVYDYIAKTPKYHVVEQTEAYFREFALKQNIPVTGSYNPSVLNLTEKAFYDGMHPRTTAIQKIFSAVP